MHARTYVSSSPGEAAAIMAREWSSHTVRVRDARRFQFEFSHSVIGPDVSLSNLAYGAPVGIVPGARDDVLLVQMPHRGSACVSFDAGSVQVDPRSYALVDVRSVSHVECNAELDMLVLRIRHRRLTSVLEAALGHKLSGDLCFSPSIVAGSVAWAEWAPVAAALKAMQASPEANHSPRFLSLLEDMIVAALLTQPHNHSQAYLRSIQAPVPAPRHVKQAEAWMWVHRGERFTSAAVAAAVGVSVRTLFEGFRRFRDSTPADFAKSLKLDGAREELRAGGMGVAEVAGRWGFKHPGNFSMHYARRFGESPSHTARFGPLQERDSGLDS